MKAKRRRYRPHVIASLACFHNILFANPMLMSFASKICDLGCKLEEMEENAYKNTKYKYIRPAQPTIISPLDGGTGHHILSLIRVLELIIFSIFSIILQPSQRSLEGRTLTRDSNSEFTSRVSKLPTFPLLGF